jgi:hypothetical protein
MQVSKSLAKIDKLEQDFNKFKQEAGRAEEIHSLREEIMQQKVSHFLVGRELQTFHLTLFIAKC